MQERRSRERRCGGRTVEKVDKKKWRGHQERGVAEARRRGGKEKRSGRSRRETRSGVMFHFCHLRLSFDEPVKPRNNSNS